MPLASFSLSTLTARLAGITALACLAAVPAQATTLSFQNFVQGYQTVSFTDTSPGASGTYAAGELQFNKVDNGITSLLRAYCVDIFQAATSTPQQYTLVSGLQHFGAEKAGDLGRLFTEFDAWNGSTSITAQETGALQMAVWEIVNETDTLNGKLKFDLSSGNFKASSTGAGTAALAQSWLNGLPTANNWYQVSAYENATYQDYLVLNKVPEPGSIALVMVALAGMSFSLRRRKLAAAKSSV